MTNRNIILNELAELESTLIGHSPQNIYAVPDGYFEGLADQILNRIKALEAIDAKEELVYLSPLLSDISKEMPYSVPEDYFQNFSSGMLQRLREHTDYQSSEAEIETLSPLLSSLKNKNPYSVPAGYFEKLEKRVVRNDSFGEKKETKVISITKHRWYRLAVAAVVIGIVAISGLVLFRSNQVDPNKNPQAWIEKNVDKKVSKDKIDELVSLVNEDGSQKADDENDAAKQAEIKELMKDVSEKEIQDFLNDAIALSANDEKNSLMN
jgi:hypothetical protein